MHNLDQVRAARAALTWLNPSGNPQLHQLITTHGPAEALTRLAGQRRPTDGLDTLPDGITGEQLRSQAAAVGTQALRAGARVVIPEDDQWPTVLADLAATPVGHAAGAALCLWVRGDAPLAATLRRAVAVVGARAATAYGEFIASEFGYGLAGRGWTVVSTGAFGIETAALRGALAGAGPVVAVLPAGVDRPYPAGNADLFDRIAGDGLLVSPWPPGTVPTRTRFAATARLVAALTGGTVLLEASRRSGALGALQQAIDLGRPAMVVPGPVTSATSAGSPAGLGLSHRD